METEDEGKLSPASLFPLQPDIDSTVETKNNSAKNTSETEENLTSKEEDVPICEAGLKEAQELQGTVIPRQETVVVNTKEEFGGGGVEPLPEKEVKAVEVACKEEEGSRDVKTSDLMSDVGKEEGGVGVLIPGSGGKEEECSVVRDDELAVREEIVCVKEAVVDDAGLENWVAGEKVEDLEELKVVEEDKREEGLQGVETTVERDEVGVREEAKEGKVVKSEVDEVVDEKRESGVLEGKDGEVKDDEGMNEIEAVEMRGDAGKGDKVEEDMNGVEAVEMPDDAERGDKVGEEMNGVEAVEIPDDAEKGDKVVEEMNDVEAVEMPHDVEKGDKVEEEEEIHDKEAVEMLEEVKKGDEVEEMNDTEAMEMPDDVEKGDKVEEEMNSADAGEEVEMREQQNEGNEEGDVEMTEETERMEEEKENVSVNASGKRKRGRIAKATSKAPSRKKMEEDVCFICFDGGDLVICDRRGCPKAYHPSCVNRDEAFFQTKGRWNCGWHLCSVCAKNAYYMCYTCTFSLCKGCVKDGVIFCVRGNKGFCETCIKTIMLIEENGQESNETAQVDFDDRSSWEYLFKDYWIDLKERLSLTSAELAQAKNLWKGSDSHTGRQESLDELNDADNDGGSESDGSSGNEDATTPKRRKPRRRLKSRAKERNSPRLAIRDGAEGATSDGSTEWASKELLEFVMHMKSGDKSICSQFDVQALLLEYIKRNKLRDPRRKSQIVCDSRLEKLFGKPRVGHFEMLKLLESHFLLKEDSQADELQESVVDTEANQLEADGNSDTLSKTGRDKKRKSRKKGDGRGVQSNVDDYAAIDMYNINLIYLRRSLMESLLEDTDTFNDKVVGAFVRIRISGSSQKQDLYRLVQVIGTSKTAEPYKVGKRMTDFLLEILNLNKTEVVSIDIISNQEFTEDECKRLRQSIKCGFINRLTVGDIREKAIALQAVRVQDSLEAEITRFSHLRDRASDMGRRKELRECVEKLQLLKSPEERQRRLEEIPDIHDDPNMDPDHESEEEAEDADDKRQENYLRPRGNNFNRRATEPVSPGKGGFASNDSWGGTRNYSSMNRELSRNASGKGFPNKGDGVDMITENLRTPVRERELQQSQGWERPQRISSSEILSSKSMPVSDSVPKTTQEVVHTATSAGTTQSAAKISETEKIWHYRDPSGKIQGPFSMVQLRKWNNTGYFPADLKIWKTNEEDDSILLTDALNGNFQKSSPLVDNNIVKTKLLKSSHLSSNYSGLAGEISKGSSSVHQTALAPLEVPKSSTDMWEVNLPSPTPSGQTSISGGMKDRAYKSRWSPTPAQHVGSVLAASPFSGNHGEQQHPPVVITETGQLPTPTPHVDGNNIAHGASLMNKPEVLSSADSQLQSLPSSVQPAFDIKSLQSLVQQVANNPLIGTNGWNAAAVSKPEMMSSPTPGSGPRAWVNAPQKSESSSSVSAPMQPSLYGNWANTPTSTPAIPTHTPGSSTVQTPSMTGFVSSVAWRAPISGQPNIQPSASSNAQWGMSSASNQSSIPQVQENITAASAWGQMPANPSMGWGGKLNRNQNQSWTPTGQGTSPGNAVVGWGTTVQAQATGNPATGWANPVPGQGYGSTLQPWGQSGQGPTLVNSASDRVTPVQGPSAGNTNRPNPSSGWTSMPPSGNNIAWASDRNHNGSRPASHRDRDWDRERDRDRDRDRDGDRNSHRGDSSHGGGRSWNRQSSFGREDSSRSSYKGNRVCKYHESGHCRKGSSCDYLHT